MTETPQSTNARKHRDREALFSATPFGENNALTAAEIADLAGLNRRSAGTKMNAMAMGEWVRLGLRSKVGHGRYMWAGGRRRMVHGATLYFREEADNAIPRSVRTGRRPMNLPEKMWVVTGSQGEYSDRTEWPVAILACGQQEAQAWVDQCSAQAREAYSQLREAWEKDALADDGVALTTELDPQTAATMWGFSPATYYLTEVRILQP